MYIPTMYGTYPVCAPLGETGTAASGTRLGGYRLCLLPGVVGAGWTEGTAAGVYQIRRLRNNPCTSSVKGLMQGLPVAHFGQRKEERDARSGPGMTVADGRARAAGERRERRRWKGLASRVEGIRVAGPENFASLRR